LVVVFPVVKAILEHKPNINALDKDGCSALTIACKEGFHEISVSLINHGAYININVIFFKLNSAKHENM
jgi:ankyrin repeat-rich membrane spanning protein